MYNSFKLPTKDELLTVVDRNNYYPAVKDIFEYILPTLYLSSTIEGSQIYVMDFGNGKYKKIDANSTAHIMCVSRRSKYPFMKYILRGLPIDFSAINMPVNINTGSGSMP